MADRKYTVLPSGEKLGLLTFKLLVGETLRRRGIARGQVFDPQAGFAFIGGDIGFAYREHRPTGRSGDSVGEDIRSHGNQIRTVNGVLSAADASKTAMLRRMAGMDCAFHRKPQ